MITMILHAKCPPDHLGNPPCCPDVSAEAIRLGPFREKLRNLHFLLLGQTRLHSLRRMRGQSLHSLLPPSFEPLADGSFARSQGHCDVLLFPPVFFQTPSAFAPFFSPIGFLWCSHASYSTILYLLPPRSVGIEVIGPVRPDSSWQAVMSCS